ncbi:hypothetical protein COU18_00520 [Candidatus Kaiserbacteria bacterium CG10_big_fil_rev_8_21_14_0_10_51_14]|uniref:Uncharacterized protein n=1 Tax=Candidatus Kaiserbacteria bacterium CG10_big_fil_rev_8_21_14_0_10_51_14 TaxID=1974610 RepID=A0A2H0UCU3_9BACT|nr:MAG: hypothetical protein COU18_00520 [Candidatus Kaiserbacteria bacterium CG10_big_fil_rev_8_21_14_0_10_51_14]
MTKSKFLSSVANAAHLLLAKVPKPNTSMYYVNDGDVYSAARSYELEATGTVDHCPVSKAIVAAAYKRDDPLQVFAAAEAAWEHYEAAAGKAKAA